MRVELEESIDGLVGRTEARRSESMHLLGSAERAELGQFFTPAPVAAFIASLARIPKSSEIRVLDPGAGAGSLSAALVARLLVERPDANIHVTACEISRAHYPVLESTLADCVDTARSLGTQMQYTIVRGDFVHWASQDDSLVSTAPTRFDLVIMNPPYSKLARNSAYRKAVESTCCEVPNLYAAFLALSVRLLLPGGQLMAITPRSFTNGAYFLSFRQYLLNRMQFNRIHVFESRDKIFAETKVLQENVIFSATASSDPVRSPVVVSSSSDLGEKIQQREVDYDHIVHPDDRDAFIHINSDESDVELVDRLAALPAVLANLGITVSTGRVVDFRAKEHLRADPVDDAVPLIYPLHMRDGGITWPVPGAKKNNAIVLNSETEKLMFPSGIYTVVKRLSSKEEKRRVVAVVFDPDHVKSSHIGFENHLNVFHMNGSGITASLARGLCLWLNSTLLDQLIRRFSGHTQVNATDLRNLRYPDTMQLNAIGAEWDGTTCLNQDKVDAVIERHLQPPTDTHMEQVPLFDIPENPTPKTQRIAETRQLLKLLNFDDERQNERSALVLLALLHLVPGTPWSEAERPILRTVEIMGWLRDVYDKDYKANTRETIRRQTLHQFVDAGLVIPNPDDPSRPVNSPKWCYQIEPRAYELVTSYQSENFERQLKSYLVERPGLVATYARHRDMNRIPVQLPSGQQIELSPGGQNPLIVKIIEEFCQRYTPGGKVLYIGDADTKWEVFEKDALANLGVQVDSHGKMPDLVVYVEEKNWLVLIEAASSHGPVDHKRYRELQNLFAHSTAGLVFVSCLPSKAELQKYFKSIAWETDVWCADNPTHLIHFNGERFLGPYDKAK